jgi:hypothetical protein
MLLILKVDRWFNVVETDANGQAVVVLEVKTTTKEAVDALVHLELV